MADTDTKSEETESCMRTQRSTAVMTATGTTAMAVRTTAKSRKITPEVLLS